MVKKKIVFLSGTRADFGKIKSLIQICEQQSRYEVHVFVTGMHMQRQYGLTVEEIEKCNFSHIFRFMNHDTSGAMDRTLAKTIDGFSLFVNEIDPDLIIIHGDRVEALAGAIVGALNNILVAHIEGGEVSGTIDELIRHSVSKLSHTHFVANDSAAKRLLQMGESKSVIYEIGSPDIDVMMSDNLPSLEECKNRYEVQYDQYAVMMFHPVTTELSTIGTQAQQLIEAALDSDTNYIVIYPNNDAGSHSILAAYKALEGNSRFRVFPSIRFEYFLTFMKNAQFIIGNSSAGIREAPYYGLPSINIGSRQSNRALDKGIINVPSETGVIRSAIDKAKKLEVIKSESYGNGDSYKKFLKVLQKEEFWQTDKQKRFRDI